MAATKVFCSFFLVIFSVLFVGIAQQNGGGGGAAPTPGSSLPCFKQLLPCQPYLHPPSNPPASCCVALNELVSTQLQCLCQIFNDAALMKNLNITQDDALKLTKECHANVDVSACKNVTVSPTGSPVTPSTPSTSNSSPPQKSAAVGVGTHFGGSAVVVAFLVFLLVSNMGFFN